MNAITATSNIIENIHGNSVAEQFLVTVSVPVCLKEAYWKKKAITGGLNTG